MALLSQLVKIGFSAIQAQHLGFTPSYGLAATGASSQANGYQLTKNINYFTTCTNGSADSIVMPSIKDNALGFVFIYNGGLGTGYVYPASGEKFNGQAADARIALLSDYKMLAFHGGNKWIAVTFL